MPAPELQIGNRTAYVRKAITTPDFESERVLARDAFQFAGLWLKRECPKALPFWEQSHSYYLASRHLPAQSSPLTSYYCFLNATKSLLTSRRGRPAGAAAQETRACLEFARVRSEEQQETDVTPLRQIEMRKFELQDFDRLRRRG
jgi:hypothetical protein